MRTISLYVHIPFCAARCPYCDFATAPARTPLRGRYLETLAREIVIQGQELGRPRVSTVYFGGGTPSLLEPAEVDGLASALRASFDLRPVEVTVEANPATLDAARLQAFQRLGLTRVSLGAQSFQAEGLRALGRAHRPADIARSVSLARDCGIRSINLDLIFGWPGESTELWGGDLENALLLRPDHISCYPLTLVHEPEDAVSNWPGGGWATLARWRASTARGQPDDDALADMYVDAERTLSRAGFVHYEIANWARPGHRSRHNLAYWRDAEWLGVGLGAHSHLEGRRSWNSGRLDAYLAGWEASRDEPHSEPAEAWESAALALRLREGLRLDAFARRHGPGLANEVRARLHSLDGAGLLRWRRDSVALTRRGRLLSNEVFVRLM